MRFPKTGIAAACFTLSALAAFVGPLPPAAADNPPPQKITTVEGITEYRLANGLQVLLFPDDSKPTLTVNVTYLVGSRHEGYGETGMAHLLEHMVFKGTPNHPQIWKALQDHGAQFNGSTSFDRTNYFETMPATDENLEFGLAMEADRMVNSHIAKKDLDSEMTVVRNEFEMGENSPAGVLSERIMSTAYLWHNYGKSTIGSREDIELVPIERLQAFYKKYYQPDNAVLIVAGKFDEAKTLARINAVFGSIPKPQRALEKTYTTEPVQDGEREVILRRVGDVQAVGAVYHICAGPHEDMAALQVLADVLSADQTGRLYKALIEPQLAVNVRASADVSFDPGVLDVMAQVRTDKSLDEARKAMLSTLENLGKATFTAEEVERAKKRFARDFTLRFNDSGRVGIGLSEWAAAGDWRLMFLHRDRLAKVTPADVQRVAAKYLKPSNRTVGLFLPEKQPDRTTVPPTPNVAELLKDYKGAKEVAKGEAFEATYEKIEGRTQRSKLPGGMKIALLPKETRGNQVSVDMAFHYGSEAELQDKTTATGFLGAMLNSGTAKHTKRQLQDRIDELQARISIGGGGGGGRRGGRGGGGGGASPGVLDVNIETTRENLPAVLELAAEMLKESNFPADEFEKMRKERLAGLEQMMSEPAALAPIELQRRMSPYPPTNIRYVPTLPERAERLKAAKVEDVKKIYTDYLGASYAEVAVVGDFDPKEITAALEKHFGNWKNPKPAERITQKYNAVKPEVVVLNTPDKANATFLLGTSVELRDDDPDYPAFFMANYILGGNSGSRLLNRIRQKEGLSYGVNSMAQAGSQDRVGAFLASGICAPQNAERAVVCAREEIERMAKEGITQQELDDARKGYHQQIGVRLASDGGVAGMLSRGLYLDRTLKFDQEQLQKIDALTPAAIQAALQKYIRPDQLLIIRAGDFEKKSASSAKPESAGG